MNTVPSISRETLISIGTAVTIIGVAVGAYVYVSNIAGDVRLLKERETEDVRSLKEKQTDLSIRSSTLEATVNVLQNEQSILTTKLDYIVKSIDAITKRLNVTP